MNFYGAAYVLLIILYALLYAPWGINETDGGFLTGLAWQVLQGKSLYTEIIYVRPPLPVWDRALELHLLPETWSVLGERWLFYLKTGLYVWWGAGVLAEGRQKAVLAFLAFVVSVHCYPAAAWHTTDGLLCAAGALWCARCSFEAGRLQGVWAFGAGVGIAGALLCKQSFYPLVALLVLLPFPTLRLRGVCGAGFAVVALLFGGWLLQTGAAADYLRLTMGAAEGGQALQHGLLDYFRIKWPLALLTAIFSVLWWAAGREGWQRFLSAQPLLKRYAAGNGFRCFLLHLWCWLLLAAYAWSVAQRRDFTLPFAQMRLLFWVAAALLLSEGMVLWKDRRKQPGKASLKRFWVAEEMRPWRFFAASLLVCWCAAVSWGYNLPILYAVPLIWALMQAEMLSGCQVRNAPDASASERPFSAWGIAMFAGLLATFFGAYQFVYRDGWRGNMTAHLGAVFPKLTGIYSDSTTLALYQELKMKTAQYGPVVTTLPAFPQAAFLTGTPPPLPLDWKVRRETGGFELRLEAALRRRRPVLFIEKSHAAALQRDNPADPELLFARKCLREGRLLEETPHFWISIYED